MTHNTSQLESFHTRTPWQAIVVVLAGLGLFGSQWVMSNDELFAHIKLKISANELEKYIGTELQDFEFEDLQNRKFSLHEFRGKRVLINVWASWCPACVAEIPTLNQFVQNMSSDTILFSIAAEDPQSVKVFMEQTDINYPVTFVAELPPMLQQVRSLPTTIIVSPDGLVEQVHSGGLNPDELQLLYETAVQLNLRKLSTSEVADAEYATSTASRTGAG